MTDPRSSNSGNRSNRKASGANPKKRVDRTSKRQEGKRQMRRMLTEQLEARQLLATAPQLIGIQPNNSELLTSGAVRNTAPNELVFRFDDVQRIDPSTLAGIRLTAAGGDGRFSVATAESDFGSNGRASIQLTGLVAGQTWTVNVTSASLGVGSAPNLTVNGNALNVTLNSTAGSVTTANQLVAVINSTPALTGLLSARLKGGQGTALLGQTATSSFSPILINQNHDRVITPGAILVGKNPNENEVTLRFAEALKDDLYRIEVFGFDSPGQGIVGLRNVGENGALGQLFRPTQPGTQKDTIDFRLDLGPQVAAVVPQPVVRVGTQLLQQRDKVVVYFDSDKMLVENDSQGNPSSRSVENPDFYQLIMTRDTVRNTDDVYLRPQSVVYNALANTATLTFAGDLYDLAGVGTGQSSYRLRIGTRETAPITPTRQEAAITAITDLNTNGAVRLRFTARQAGEDLGGIQVQFSNSLSGNPAVNVNGRTIQIDLGRNDLTAAQLVTLLRASATVMNLVSVDEVGGNTASVVGATNLSFSPVRLVGMGGTFDTGHNLGVIGSVAQSQTSLILSSSIDPKPLPLDLPGASDDAGHRQFLQGIVDNLEDHINARFGADATAGVKTIFYNFRTGYAQDLTGGTLTNAIDNDQRQRAREVLSLWSRYAGVQFVETVDQGLTIAVGPFSSINSVANTQVVNLPQIQTGTQTFPSGVQFPLFDLPGTVRIDPTFNNSLIVLSATTPWGELYGQNFTRVMAASVGLVLGLTNGGDLSTSELMKFDPLFLGGIETLVDANGAPLDANEQRFEPVFPGNQDILHVQHIHRPDSNDIDFYRFEVDFGGADRVGSLVAETQAQRLADSSELNTVLQLYRQHNALGRTTFNSGGLVVEFESLRPGAQGNEFQVRFTQSELGPGQLPTVQVLDNAISIDLNASQGSESTAQQILDVIANSPEASRLVRGRVIQGIGATRVGGNLLTQNPVRLLGGRFELIAQNDDYFSRDSLLKQTLGSGVYYIGVSASGNNHYNGSVEDSGFGGKTQGRYELRLNFRADVDPRDTLQDNSGQFSGDIGVGLDGNLDGTPGGTYDFWFQTRPLNRTLSFTSGGVSALEGRTVTLIGANGTQRVFEFSSDTNIGAGRIRIPYTTALTPSGLASSFASSVNARSELGVTVSVSGSQVTLSGERTLSLDSQLQQSGVISVGGRTIFVDKAAGPNADGSLARPFNNISSSSVANAFAAALPGDIVRIVGNGGTDNNLSTIENNFAYEIGRGVLAGTTLSDGLTMDIPKGVIAMVDAGAVFKLRQAAIQAGSSDLNIDRNGAVLQVLGAPVLLDASGNAIRTTAGSLASGQVSFTSWLDESIGLDNYSPVTRPNPGDWGGILTRRDLDRASGRKDLEDEGIFLRHINYADIRYGGGIVNVGSIQQVIDPIQVLANRPTIINNLVRFASSAAISTDLDSLEENTFNEPRFQLAGAFTSDYDRVGPTIHGNRLTNNSVNGLFVRVPTAADGLPQRLTVPARMNDRDIVHVLTENLVIAGAVGGSFLDNTQANPVKTPRLSGSLVVDPGMVLKIEAARIEAQMGANIIAEGLDGLPIYLTSRLDDTIGAGGTFDTNNNSSQTSPSAGDWGGVYISPTSRLSLDHGRISYGGGITKLEGTFRAFNTIEVHQADARIANTEFSNNANGMGGQGPATRLGRMANSPATIFVRGAQPTIIGNTMTDNDGSAIRINVNSMTSDIVRDDGRQTGPADRDTSLIANRGPLVRNNRLSQNGLNALEIRAGTLTTGSVWDDTDIVHVVRGPIFTGNIQHSGGLRLQSSPTESLVVKFDGYGSNFNNNLGAGLTANGQLTSAPDRVGGTLHIVGQPGFPVVLTSLKDDTVGAGQQPNGSPQTDTNNDGIGSIPQPADWRGVLIDQYSNDRNVALVLESESPLAAAPGTNAIPSTAQVLGDLAGSSSDSTESRRLGFVVEGVLSEPADADVYSFTGVGGSEVWLDVDYTRHDLDMVLELLDAQGNLLARSTSSTLESEGQAAILSTDLISATRVSPLNDKNSQLRRNAAGLIKEDGTTNIKDPGMRVRLPGSSGVRSTFYFRLRSRGQDIESLGSGLSAGAYQVQVRLRAAQEWAGSTVNFADIRYAMNGVRLRGMPGESPLIGEAMEDESAGTTGNARANNGVAFGNGRVGFSLGSTTSGLPGNTRFGDAVLGNRPQYIGNIMNTAKGAFSVAGSLNQSTDVDFYMFDVRQEDLIGSVGKAFSPVVFDIDYADGLNRPDTTIHIFQQEDSENPFNQNPTSDPQYRLVYSSEGSNIADDQPRPSLGTDMQDLSRGSAGTRDPFIGPIALAEGTYLVAVTSVAMLPRAVVPLPSVFNLQDRKPIQSVRRIVDEGFQAGVSTADPPIVQNFLQGQTLTAGVPLVTAGFDLGVYSAADLATLYLDYENPSGTFTVTVGATNPVDPSQPPIPIGPAFPLPSGTNTAFSLPLSSVVGRNDLRLIFETNSAAARLNNVVIGSAERGEQLTVNNEDTLIPAGGLLVQGPDAVMSTIEFDLETYSALTDSPAILFQYQVILGELDVYVVDQDGVETLIGTTVAAEAGNPIPFLLSRGESQTLALDLSRWAPVIPGIAAPGPIRVEFRSRDLLLSSSVISGAHILLRDGSRVLAGEPNATFGVNPSVPTGAITTGSYQLEVRLGDNFFQSPIDPLIDSPTLTRSFDTNDRLAPTISITTPSGAKISAGDKFSISDGINSVIFEFTQSGLVAPGNIAVPFATGDTDFVVARTIRNVINGTAVQSRIQVRAASTNGISSGIAGVDKRLNLFGNATVTTLQAAPTSDPIEVTYHHGRSDRNVNREQGQVIIQNSFIRHSRDYGVWSEPAARLPDPRDQLDPLMASIMQTKPNLVGTQAIRNLPVANSGAQGGLLPGVVIQNNVLEEGRLGGVNISGENPIWMISPQTGRMPATDNSPTVNGTDPPSHFGYYLDDRDVLIVDSDRTRLKFEFEDLAGGGNGSPVFGSGQEEGNGYLPDSSIAWYRDTGGSYYQRSTGGSLQPFATNAFETMHALRDSILGSILVTNGTTQIIRPTIAESLLGPDPGAPPTSDGLFYPEYFNRPAVYLEGATYVEFINTVGLANPFDIRTLDLGTSPQPHARIVNNTVIGRDGRAAFNGESPLNEVPGTPGNDTIGSAVQTWQGTSAKPLVYSEVGFIGDGGQVIAGVSPPLPNGGGGTTVAPPATNASAPFTAGRVIVGFNDNLTQQQQELLLQGERLNLVKRFKTINAVVAQIPDGRSVASVISLLENLPQVKYAEPDYLKTLQRQPNDPSYSQLWGLNNTGQTGGTPEADIRAEQAWDLHTGSANTVVAVIDSGVDYNHPDLRANRWTNPGEISGNGIDDDRNGFIDDIFGWDFHDDDADPMDVNSHGTHVAGTIASRGNNALGVTGVSWNSKIMALKVGPSSTEPTIVTSAVIEAIDYMTMMKTRYGVNIVVSNNSYGGPSSSQAEEEAIARSIGAGILFVAAAGNDTRNNDSVPQYPASYSLDGIITVAATDHNDRLAGFSNFGTTSVDIAAPGVNILSTIPGGGYDFKQGTSMAAPHVAGVAALLAGNHPELTVAQLKSALMVGADPKDGLRGATATGARLNALNSLRISNIPTLTANDVDVYQFKLGLGERAFVNIETGDSGLQAALQIFDSSGTPQRFNNFQNESVIVSGNEGPNGTWIGRDPIADFTALKPGVYYAAVSSIGNTNYDPLSMAGRNPGASTGAYRISIDARTLQEFVISAQDASAYTNGQTFTIHGISDNEFSGSTGVTFEFVIGLGDASNPTHIPINLDSGWRFPDVARAIAKAINEGNFGLPSISNAQQLPNGKQGTASPLPAVHAQALGGLAGVLDAPLTNIVGDVALVLEQLSEVDELGTNALPIREIERQLNGPIYQVNQGLRLFPRRLDGNINSVTTTGTLRGRQYTHTQITTLSHLGLGHDRLSTTPLSPTSIADGTTEKFVVVKNAAFIESNGAILVSSDPISLPLLNTSLTVPNSNLNQLIPETGVLATRGASPTILNNVFFNVQTPVINEESRKFPITNSPAPYGTNNPNTPIKPGQVILAGSIYQAHETSSSVNRFLTGIESSPTNVPNTASDFNTVVPASTRLFVNAQAGNYLPAPGSPLIDSAIDSLPERNTLASLKSAIGLSVSPIIAPGLDIFGQLRTDDASVAPPQGQGVNVFKDRGALERSDIIGPAAILLNPTDNDAQGIDQDPSSAVVQLVSGVYPEFRIQLRDGAEPNNPLAGLGIDDDSVVNAVIDGLRSVGAAVVILENGRLLTEGVDYRFAYNTTSDEIVLTPLAGVWKPGHVYEIMLNNRDRFVLSAPAANQTLNGKTFSIVDQNGGVHVFEFDNDNALLGTVGSVQRVPFGINDSSEDIKRAIIAAINAVPGSILSATDRGGGTLFVTGATSVTGEMGSYFQRGIVDLAGNFLTTSELDNETRFTILMPGVELDFGDAPDPLSTTLGRYNTLFGNNGARHRVSDRALLGAAITADSDGQPSADALRDEDDGVVWGTNYQLAGLFNRNFQTSVTVTLSSPGSLDGWIDWNADGDWDDPGEYVFQSVSFGADQLVQTFQVAIPETTPVPTSLTQTFARMRSSTRGSLAPIGLAVDGEVEDYRVYIAPGTPPQAFGDQYLVSEDGQLITTDPLGQITVGFNIDDGVLANDVSPDAKPLGATLVAGPANAAQFQLNPNGTFTYRPRPNFFGVDTFTYRSNDGLLNSTNIGTVTITVVEINDPPVAVNDILEGNEDQTLVISPSAILSNDSAGPEENGQVLTVTSVQTASQNSGTVSLVGGEIRYTPPDNFFGSDTFTYTITDNGTTAGIANPLTAIGTVTVLVREVNDPPVPGVRSDQMQENRPSANTAIEFNAQTLVDAAVSGPADEQLWQAVRFVGVGSSSQRGGSVSWNSITNMIRFVPALHFAGADTFTYEIEDFSTDPLRPLLSSRSLGTVTVNIANINDAPFVQNALGTREILEDSAASLINLNAVFSDHDIAVAGDALTFQVISQSNAGLVQATVVGNSLRIEPQPDKNGQTSIIVEAKDITGLTVRDTLTLTVTPVNDAPRLVNPLPSISVNKNTVIPVITLSPDHFFDPDVETNGDVLTYEIVGNSNPALVSATVVNGVLNLTLLPNQFGTGSVVVRATDSTNQSVTGAVTLTIANVNDPPVGRPDGYRVPQNSTLNVNASQAVLANDTDAEGQPLTAILVSGPQNATQFSLSPNGAFTYRHNGISRQSDSFTYRASDGVLQSELITVTITIDAPLPSTHQNQSNNLDVNADGRVTAIDALLIINLVNSMPSPIRVESLGTPPPYFDVNGDYRVTAFDALLVINELNRRSSGGGSGEGEAEDRQVAAIQGSSMIDVHRELVNQKHDLQTVPSSPKPDELISGSQTVGHSTMVPAAGADIGWIVDRSRRVQRNQIEDVALIAVLDQDLSDELLDG
jgi:subtilisin family serine protease